MSYQKVQILAPVATGNNLMSTLLMKNFNIRGINIWGHTFPETIIDYYNNNNTTLFIFLIKNPYFWFQSVMKITNIWGVIKGDSTSLNNFITNRITYTHNGDAPFKWEDEFDSLVECYNKYYTTVLKLSERDNVIVIKYEDLLFNCENVIDKISKLLDKSHKNVFSVEYACGPHKRNRKQSLDYYSDNKNMYNDMNNNTINFIKNNLNKSIIEEYYNFLLNYK